MVNYHDLSGTPCALPPLPPPPAAAVSIFSPSPLFIPLYHHTMGGMHRIHALIYTRMEADTRTFKRRIIDKKQRQTIIFSFIKNKTTSSKIFPYSGDKRVQSQRHFERFTQTRVQKMSCHILHSQISHFIT